MRLLTVAVFAVACGDSDDAKPNTGTVGGDDTAATSIVYVDADRDGYNAGEDCDDNDYRVYPGADEICDGKDNDCNDETDEGFDLDEDGALNLELCADIGTDCDDADPNVPTDEVPYDGIDQDCDGADLADVDGDGHAGRAAGGNDCDDNAADVYPGADEVPLDGIDQDCNGIDLVDGDDDGYTAAEHGGTDCDDADPAVHPDAMDWYGDAVDSDCDGVDGGLFNVANAHAIIGGDSGSYAVMGHDVEVCDLDSDGLPDLVVTAPYDGDYNGAIGVFYGRHADEWSGNMTLDNAGTRLRSDQTAWGFGAACADVDGDGRDDLVIGQGEVQFGPFVSDYSVHIKYGVGGMLPGIIDTIDVDATITTDLGAVGGSGEVRAGLISATDLTGDGAAEIVIDQDEEGTEFGESALFIIPGAEYSGVSDLSSVIIASVGDPQGDTVTALTSSGFALAVGQAGYRDGMPSGATDPSAYPLSGQVAIVELVGGVVDSIATAASLRLVDLSGAAALGHAVAFGDVDGDGERDLGAGAPLANANGGSVYLVSDVEALADTTAAAFGALDIASEASHIIHGTAGLGTGLAIGNDMDGDGVADVLITESGADGVGAVWLVSGARLEAGDNALADVAVLGIRAQYASERLGDRLVVADFDGDGVEDFAIASSHFPTPASVGLAPSGRVAIFMSSRY